LPLIGLPACAATQLYQGPVSGGPRFGIAGLRTQGRRHLQNLLRRADVDVAAVCDPDPRVLGYAVASAARQGRRVLAFADVREMLDSDAIDAVTVATPDHWHFLLAAWASQSGKHVYIESPPTHGIAECDDLAELSLRSGKVVRAAMPLRGDPGIRRGVEFLQQGKLGSIREVKAFCFLTRRPIGQASGPCALPQNLDFDLWAGPAPFELPHRRMLHGDWRFDWRTGNGDLGEWGFPILDLARWIAGCSGFPNRVWVCGGRVGQTDAGETPNTLLAGLKYPSMTIVYEACSAPSVRRVDRDVGNVRMGVVVTGSKGRMVFDAQQGVSRALNYDDELLGEFQGQGDPLGDFAVDLIGRRDRPELLRSALDSARLVHLLNNLQRTASSCKRTDVLRQLVDDRPVLNGFDSLDGSLVRGGVDFDQGMIVNSGWRVLHPTTGECLDFPAANAFRKRSYRAPFVRRNSTRPV
jgi:predicted dehydrogenase